MYMHIIVVSRKSNSLKFKRHSRVLVTYSHGPVTGGSRQVSLGHCTGGTHLSPNSIRPSGQKHPGDTCI